MAGRNVVQYECSKLLFNYGQKDNWNKADILLVNNNLLNLEKITNLFKDAFCVKTLFYKLYFFIKMLYNVYNNYK